MDGCSAEISFSCKRKKHKMALESKNERTGSKGADVPQKVNEVISAI